MSRRAIDRLAVALDVPDLARARELISTLRGQVGVFKVGLELFTAAGPVAAQAVADADAACFLDLKLHDIPATMARAAAAAARHEVRYLTVHASAGPRALAAVGDALAGSRTRALAVTVLTSMDDAELLGVGFGSGARAAVERLARLATDAGIDGFVCSPDEAPLVRRLAGPGALIVTPGVRPSGSSRGDQRRVTTPARAIELGADLLVVGRPVRDAPDPAAAARAIAAEIEQALQGGA